jgi:hypothetical protein
MINSINTRRAESVASMENLKNWGKIRSQNLKERSLLKSPDAIKGILLK